MNIISRILKICIMKTFARIYFRAPLPKKKYKKNIVNRKENENLSFENFRADLFLRTPNQRIEKTS